MFGIDGGELIVLLAVAAVVLGPERLPQYAQQLAHLVRDLRKLAQGASEQVKSELGPEFDDIDWRKFDPRQYDPRRIVREALSDAWDPDDPLGLGEKPVSRGGPGVLRGLGLDLDEIKDELLGGPSANSPGNRAKGETNLAPAPAGGGTGVESATVAAPVEPPVPGTPFDPDAT